MNATASTEETPESLNLISRSGSLPVSRFSWTSFLRRSSVDDMSDNLLKIVIGMNAVALSGKVDLTMSDRIFRVTPAQGVIKKPFAAEGPWSCLRQSPATLYVPVPGNFRGASGGYAEQPCRCHDLQGAFPYNDFTENQPLLEQSVCAERWNPGACMPVSGNKESGRTGSDGGLTGKPVARCTLAGFCTSIQGPCPFS